VWSEDEDPVGADDEVETVPCPACGQEVYEDADQCPKCGEWIIPLAGRRSAWPKLVAVVLIAALLFGVLAGLVRWLR
jgi:hypothetical protein